MGLGWRLGEGSASVFARGSRWLEAGSLAVFAGICAGVPRGGGFLS